MPQISNAKKLLLACLLVFNILNGFLRYHYIINFYDFNDLIARRSQLQFTYPHSFSELISSIIYDPRWFSNIYFMAIAILSTLLSVYLIFGKKMARIAFFCYLSLVIICLLLVLLTLVTGNYKVGFGLAQELKNMAQSPLISFLILSLFYFSSKDFKSASE